MREVISLKLSDFIALHCTDKLPDTAGELYKGFLLSGLGLRPPSGFHLVGTWSTQGRRVWVSDTDFAFITYVEGDLFVKLCPDRATYDAEYLRTGDYYREY